jgi:predicted acetyltransferase
VGLDIRPVTVDEHDRAVSLFMTALLMPPRVIGNLEAARALSLDRTFGAFVDGELVGTATSFAADLVVPGGAPVPSAAVTRVGVLPTHTRRGILRALMGVQLEDVRSRGEVVAHLRASEAAIYGRFGYGVATCSVHWELERIRGARRAPVEAPGRFRLLDEGEAASVLPRVYDRCWRRRAGMMSRSDDLWSYRRGMAPKDPPARWTVVHEAPDGEPDGFAEYEASDRFRWSHGSGRVQVHELWAADDLVEAALWAWLLELDLAPVIAADGRPVDEPLRWRLTDPRALRTTDVLDETWLRLVDVGAALAGRSYGPGEPVVIEVVDGLLPDNAGTWRVGGVDGVGGRPVERVSSAPDLVVDVDVLGATWLGGTSWAELAAAGRVTVCRASAVAEADRLFATSPAPWCGTHF